MATNISYASQISGKRNALNAFCNLGNVHHEQKGQ